MERELSIVDVADHNDNEGKGKGEADFTRRWPWHQRRSLKAREQCARKAKSYEESDETYHH
jgi:hypothetical protein